MQLYPKLNGHVIFIDIHLDLKVLFGTHWAIYQNNQLITPNLKNKPRRFLDKLWHSSCNLRTGELRFALCGFGLILTLKGIFLVRNNNNFDKMKSKVARRPLGMIKFKAMYQTVSQWTYSLNWTHDKLTSYVRSV